MCCLVHCYVNVYFKYNFSQKKNKRAKVNYTSLIFCYFCLFFFFLKLLCQQLHIHDCFYKGGEGVDALLLFVCLLGGLFLIPLDVTVDLLKKEGGRGRERERRGREVEQEGREWYEGLRMRRILLLLILLLLSGLLIS